MKKLVLMLTLSLLIYSFASYSTISNSTGEISPIHTRISDLDLGYSAWDGGDQFASNVSIFTMGVSVEVWNTASDSQEISYLWRNTFCGYYLDVSVTTTDDAELYSGPPVYTVTCTVAASVYDPGLTTVQSAIQLIFNDFGLTDFPNGQYVISAPTQNGDAYSATMVSTNGSLSYVIEPTIGGWGQITKETVLSEVCTGQQSSNCDAHQLDVSSSKGLNGKLTYTTAFSFMVFTIFILQVLITGARKKIDMA